MISQAVDNMWYLMAIQNGWVTWYIYWHQQQGFPQVIPMHHAGVCMNRLNTSSEEPFKTSPLKVMISTDILYNKLLLFSPKISILLYLPILPNSTITMKTIANILSKSLLWVKVMLLWSKHNRNWMLFQTTQCRFVKQCNSSPGISILSNSQCSKPLFH